MSVERPPGLFESALCRPIVAAIAGLPAPESRQLPPESSLLTYQETKLRSFDQ